MSTRRAMIEEAIGGFKGVSDSATAVYGKAAERADEATQDIMDRPLLGGGAGDSPMMQALGAAGYKAGERAAERRGGTMNQRLAGMTPQQIADEAGVDIATATRMKKNALKNVQGEKGSK